MLAFEKNQERAGGLPDSKDLGDLFPALPWTFSNQMGEDDQNPNTLSNKSWYKTVLFFKFFEGVLKYRGSGVKALWTKYKQKLVFTGCFLNQNTTFFGQVAEMLLRQRPNIPH